MSRAEDKSYHAISGKRYETGYYLKANNQERVKEWMKQTDSGDPPHLEVWCWPEVEKGETVKKQKEDLEFVGKRLAKKGEKNGQRFTCEFHFKSKQKTLGEIFELLTSLTNIGLFPESEGSSHMKVQIQIQDDQPIYFWIQYDRYNQLMVFFDTPDGKKALPYEDVCRDMDKIIQASFTEVTRDQLKKVSDFLIFPLQIFKSAFTLQC